VTWGRTSDTIKQSVKVSKLKLVRNNILVLRKMIVCGKNKNIDNESYSKSRLIGLEIMHGFKYSAIVSFYP